jgi:SAM-dependent methyltransferase
MLLPMKFVQSLKVLHLVSPHDQMFHPDAQRHYFYVGRSNLHLLLNILSIRSSYSAGDGPIENILDFGCGHGRVARWIRAGFPNAQIYVTDFDKTGVEWCVEKLGCRGIAGTIPIGFFDLVWLGSVFTHLPEHVAAPLLQELLGALRPNGVLVVTTQGRYSVERMKDFDYANDPRDWMHYALSKKLFDVVVKGYSETGYGYVDYPGQKDYGVCIAEPAWYSKRVLASNDFIQILFQEKGSDNHQDVSAFMRASVLDISKGPLW